MGARALHRGRPPAPDRQARRPLRRRGRGSSAGRRRLHRGHQPVHLRGAAGPEQDARRVRRDRQAAGPTTGRHRRDRDRVAGRRHLRQGRRQRARPGRSCSTRPRSVRPEKRPAACGASSAAVEDPEAPTTVTTARRFAYQATPKASWPRAPRRCPTRARSRRARSPASSGTGARRRRRRRAAGILGGLVAFPKRDVERAAAVGARSPASGRPIAVIGPAGRLLRPADPDGGGPPRPGHRRPRRRVPRRQPLRAARPRPRLRLERDLGRPGHHRHFAGAHAARRHALPLPRQVPGDRDPRPDELVEPNAGRLDAAGDARRCTRQRTKLGIVAGRGTYKGKPVRLTALRSTYMHEVDSARGFSDFNTPTRCRAPRTSSAPPTRSATRSTGSTSTTSTSPTSTPATTRCAREGHRPDSCPMARQQASGRAATPTSTSPTTRRSPSTRRSSTSRYITSWNNKQAPGYAGADANLFSSVFRSQMLDEQIARGIARRRQDDAARADRRDGGRRHDRPARRRRSCRCALKVIGKPERPAARGRGRDAARVGGAGAHRDATATRTARTTHADAIRIMDAWWPRLDAGRVRAGAWARRCFDALHAMHDSTTPRTTTATTSARPTRTAGTATCRRTCDACWRQGQAAATRARYCGRGNRAAAAARCVASLRGGDRAVAARALRGRRQCCREPAGRRPVCCDEVSFRAAGRRHAAADPLDQPADLPAGRRRSRATAERLILGACPGRRPAPRTSQPATRTPTPRTSSACSSCSRACASACPSASPRSPGESRSWCTARPASSTWPALPPVVARLHGARRAPLPRRLGEQYVLS